MYKPAVLFYSHQANLAGAPLSLCALANELRSDYHCIFATPVKGPVLDKVKCGTAVIGPFFQTLALIRLIKKYNVSLVHANTCLAQPAAHAARLTNTPLVWHIREDLSSFPHKLPHRILSLADRVVIISDSMRAYFPPSEKIVRIYNGIEFSVPKKNIKEAIPVILFAGTIEPRKGVRELLLAAKILHGLTSRPFKVAIYGEPLATTHRYYRSLQRFIRENHLEHIIEWKGVTPAIQKAISAADIIAVPSLAEPFGRVAVEAMAAGKPVVASKCGGLPEIVKHNTTGLLFSRGMSRELALCLEKLLLNPHKAKAMGRAGRMRYKKLFTLDAHVEAIKKMYVSIIKER